MRHILFGLFFALILSTAGFAQKQMYFATGEQCIQALQNGTAAFYHPKAFNLKKAVNPSTEVETQLEDDTCIEMIVDRSRNMNDFHIVAQPTGTKMVKELNGLTMKRRLDCGNPVRERWNVPIPVPVKPQATPTPITVAGPCVPTGMKQEAIMENGKQVGVTKSDGCKSWTEIARVREVVINPCPAKIIWKNQTSWGARLGGGLPQLGISGGGSVLASWGLGGNKGDMTKSAIGGAISQRIQQGLNAGEDGTKITIPGYGVENVYIHEGDDTPLKEGFSVRWHKGHATLYRTYKNEEYRCDGDGMKDASNTGIVAINSGDDTEDVYGVKTLPTSGSQVPVRTGTGTNTPTGQLPGGSVPNPTSTTGRITRPTMGNNLVEEAYGSSQNAQTLNSASTTVVTPCTGQLIMMDGKPTCVNN